MQEHDVHLSTETMRDFKESQMRSARKSFSNANSRPNSRVAALIEKEDCRRLVSSLVPSKATLLVIPNVLMEHWKVRVRWTADGSIAQKAAAHSLSCSVSDTSSC